MQMGTSSSDTIVHNSQWISDVEEPRHTAPPAPTWTTVLTAWTAEAAERRAAIAKEECILSIYIWEISDDELNILHSKKRLTWLRRIKNWEGRYKPHTQQDKQIRRCLRTREIMSKLQEIIIVTTHSKFPLFANICSAMPSLTSFSSPAPVPHNLSCQMSVIPTASMASWELEPEYRG